MAKQVPLAIVLHGSIGVGKTTLGEALARHLGGSYIDGDKFQHAGRPWFASSRTVAGELVKAAIGATHTGAPAVLGYPLRCTDHRVSRSRASLHRVGAAADCGDDRARLQQSPVEQCLDRHLRIQRNEHAEDRGSAG